MSSSPEGAGREPESSLRSEGDRTGKEVSFSDWLASVVERKEVEVRDPKLKSSKEDAKHKAGKKQEERGR